MEEYENNTYSEAESETAEEGSDIQNDSAEIIEAEIIEEADSVPSDSAEENPADGTEADETVDAEKDEDISSVAEQITASVSPFASVLSEKTEDNKKTAYDDLKSIFEDDGEEEHDNGGFFDGFTVKKAIVTVVSAAITVLILSMTMVTAVNFTGDKTKRQSDYDMTNDPETEETVREEAALKPPVYQIDEESAQFKVRLDFFDREDIELYTTKMTLDEMLGEAGIVLLDGEESTVAGDTMIGSSVTIPFDKYETVTDVVSESLPYETERRESDLIWIGTTNYIQNGKEGRAEITYSVKLKNGEEISREEVGRYVAEEPVKEIYEVGVGGSFVGGDGKTYTYSMRKIVTATYYYIPDDPYTYLGNHPDHSTIAVDMNVIPLKTWLYVKNSKYDFGLRQAQDIGGAIKGDMIDIWLDGSEPGYESFKFTGIHYDMEVYYVDQHP